MTTIFGAPDYDVSTEYQSTDESGRWQNGSAVFTHQHSRVVCWTDVLCLTFGGATAEGLQFVGWSYDDTTGIGPVTLSTADGIAMGSLLSDHLGSITAPPHSGCYSSTSGTTTNGMEVSLYSVGEPFFTYDTTGAFIEGSPPPEDIVVSGLAAGDRVGELDMDC